MEAVEEGHGLGAAAGCSSTLAHRSVGHKSIKGECIRPGTPLSLDDARRLVGAYNNVRLNSATGYITPKDMPAGRQQEIHAERDRKLEAARKQRRIRRKPAA